jgi:putative transposase
MSRRLRVFFSDVAAHIVQRGADRGVCFRSDNDRILYLLHLRELSEKFGCVVHAYCLMTNHVHLLVTPTREGGAQAMMKGLGQHYAQFFNRVYQRTGPLWDGRYHSCIVESSYYVLACCRYIELNPVRAGMVNRPADYRWSSYRANADGADDRLVRPHTEFLALGNTSESRRSAYQAMFDQIMDAPLLESIRASTNGGYPLASAEFTLSLAAMGVKVSPTAPGPRPGIGV